MNMLQNWFDSNLLTLNAKKTKFLEIGRVWGENDDQHVVIHGCNSPRSGVCSCDPIEKVNHHKYLGVIFDDKLRWEQHVIALASRLRRFVHIFYGIRSILPRDRLKLVYDAMVQSVLQYGIHVWGSAVDSVLQKLIVVQKAILKTRFRLPRRHPSDDLFQFAKAFTIKQLYCKNLLLMFFKNPTLCQPTSHHYYSTRYALEGGARNQRPRLQLTTRSPSYVFSILYRNLPAHLKSPSLYSRDNYKKKVYDYLISNGPQRIEQFLISQYVV